MHPPRIQRTAVVVGADQLWWLRQKLWWTEVLPIVGVGGVDTRRKRLRKYHVDVLIDGHSHRKFLRDALDVGAHPVLILTLDALSESLPPNRVGIRRPHA